MKEENLTKKELEQLCVEEGIILERTDFVSSSTFFVPNLKKIKIMIHEFDFLVEGAARGRSINEISNIEMYLYEHESEPEKQKILLATNYSKSSIYLESKTDLISDKDSENWDNILIQHFTLSEIYKYFHKTKGASNYFRKFNIYEEMIDLNYHIKLMEYLQDQIQIYNPSSEDKEIPYSINSLEMTLLIFQKLGTLDKMKKEMKEDYYENAAKLLVTMLGKPTSNWHQIRNILWDIDNEESNITTDSTLKANLKDILYHYKIEHR